MRCYKCLRSANNNLKQICNIINYNLTTLKNITRKIWPITICLWIQNFFFFLQPLTDRMSLEMQQIVNTLRFAAMPTHTHTHTHSHSYTHAYKHTHSFKYLHTYTHTNTQTHIYKKITILFWKIRYAHEHHP